MAYLGSASNNATATDRISSLPEEVLHHILSFLDMKYSIRTSIFSKRWRYLWTFNPNLEFYLGFNIRPRRLYPWEWEEEEEDKFFGIISRCLSLYKLPNINRFFIHLETNKDISSDAEKWITFATSRGVRELILLIEAQESDFPSDESAVQSNLPKILYSHRPLVDLTLSVFRIDLPHDFKGFPSLKVLELRDVRITDYMVQTFLLTCPLLEKLNMSECDDLINLSISAPNMILKFLLVVGCMRLGKLVVNAPNLLSFNFLGKITTKIYLMNASPLLDADVKFCGNIKPELVHEWTPFVQSIATHANSLTVESWLSQFVFAEYCVRKSPHIVFINLQELHWSGHLNSRYEILALATFIGDCPFLQKLHIDSRECSDWYCQYYGTLNTPGGTRNLSRRKEKAHSLLPVDYMLTYLKTVEILGFMGTNKEMDLVRSLLLQATVLDSMRLTCGSSDMTVGVQEKLSRLPKTSTHAKIVIE